MQRPTSTVVLLFAVVDGERRVLEARATLLDALRSYTRRNDWGLIYPCELRIEVGRDPSAPDRGS